MQLIGYLYGIKSERRFEGEVALKLAYRWFCGTNFVHRVPDHSTFSQNRRRRFKKTSIFREIFNEIVRKCIEIGIISGETKAGQIQSTVISIRLVKGAGVSDGDDSGYQSWHYYWGGGLLSC